MSTETIKINVPRNTGGKKKEKRRQRKTVQQGGTKKGAQKTSKAMVSLGNLNRNTKPRIITSRNGADVLVSHREYIADVNSSVSPFAAISQYTMNPGNSITFPWLAKIAQRFESYIFRRLKFSFSTECSTTQTGYVVLSPQYDPQDPVPTTKSSAMQAADSVKGAPWENIPMFCTTENLRKRKTYLVRDSTQFGNLYDTGILNVGVGGNFAANTNLGELWVDYEVELMTPVLTNGGRDGDPFYVSSTNPGNSGISNALPFGLSPLLVSSGVVPVEYDTTSGSSKLVFRRNYSGTFSFLLTGGGFTAANLQLTPTSGVTVLNRADIVNSAGAGEIVTVTVNALASVSSIPDPPQSLTITVAGITAATTGLTLRVGVYDSSLP